MVTLQSSSQNNLSLKGTGTGPSPGAINIISFSWDVLINTVSFDTYL